MKAKLNLTIDESLLYKVKRIAEERESSVSQIVEEFFRNFVHTPTRESFVDLIDSLPEISYEEGAIRHSPETDSDISAHYWYINSI